MEWASHLTLFEARLKFWLGVVGKSNFHKLMCDGVASGLSGEGYAAFEARLKYWLGVVGKSNFHKFMRNSVASGLSGEGYAPFEARLQYWLVVVGKHNFPKFMRNSVASVCVPPVKAPAGIGCAPVSPLPVLVQLIWLIGMVLPPALVSVAGDVARSVAL